MPVPRDGRVTFGVETTRNVSDGPVRIERVGFTRSTGMTVLGAKVLLVPSKGAFTLVGARSGWPPRLDAREGPVRDLFQTSPDARGASVPAGREHDVSFVVGVRAEDGGRAGPLTVDYRDADGHQHTWTGATTYRTAARCGGS